MTTLTSGSFHYRNDFNRLLDLLKLWRHPSNQPLTTYVNSFGTLGQQSEFEDDFWTMRANKMDILCKYNCLCDCLRGKWETGKSRIVLPQKAKIRGTAVPLKILHQLVFEETLLTKWIQKNWSAAVATRLAYTVKTLPLVTCHHFNWSVLLHPRKCTHAQSKSHSIN